MYNPLLYTFIIVCECKSFNKAADKLYITPASVMNQINTLEEQMELKLFERSKKGLTQTSAGQIIYKEAKIIIEHSNKVIQNAKNIQEISNKTIRVGSSFLNPCHVLLDYCKRNMENNSQYNFQIVPFEDDHNKILSIIEALGKEIDILVGAFNSPKMQAIANYLIIGQYDLCISVSKNHPLSHKKVIRVEDLYGQKLIIPRQEKIDEFSNLRTLYPKIMIEETTTYYDINTFNQCEQKNEILLTLSAWKNIHPSLVTLPVAWEHKVDYGLLYPKKTNKKIDDFIEQISKLKNDQLN